MEIMAEDVFAAGTLGWAGPTRVAIVAHIGGGSRKFAATDNKSIVVVVVIASRGSLLSIASLFAVSPVRSLLQSMSPRASDRKA